MHLDVMSDNLVKLASEIDNIVGYFVSRAGDPNAGPRYAVRQVLKKNVNNVLNKWNEILDKAPDADYEVLKNSTALDLKIECALSGGQYACTIRPEIVPSRNKYGETQLQPTCNGVAGVAAKEATKVIEEGNTSFGIYEKEYLVFTVQ